MFGFACDILSGTEICKFQEVLRINFILKLTKALYLSIKIFAISKLMHIGLKKSSLGPHAPKIVIPHHVCIMP